MRGRQPEGARGLLPPRQDDRVGGPPRGRDRLLRHVSGRAGPGGGPARQGRSPLLARGAHLLDAVGGQGRELLGAKEMDRKVVVLGGGGGGGGGEGGGPKGRGGGGRDGGSPHGQPPVSRARLTWMGRPRGAGRAGPRPPVRSLVPVGDDGCPPARSGHRRPGKAEASRGRA